MASNFNQDRAQNTRRLRHIGGSFYSPRRGAPYQVILGFGVEIEIISIPTEELVLVHNADVFQNLYRQQMVLNLFEEGERAKQHPDPSQGDPTMWFITKDESLYDLSLDQSRSYPVASRTQGEMVEPSQFLVEADQTDIW